MRRRRLLLWNGAYGGGDWKVGMHGNREARYPPARNAGELAAELAALLRARGDTVDGPTAHEADPD